MGRQTYVELAADAGVGDVAMWAERLEFQLQGVGDTGRVEMDVGFVRSLLRALVIMADGQMKAERHG